jgi:hypothetical protein
MNNAVLDRLLGGRGVAWVRYEPHIVGEMADEADGAPTAQILGETNVFGTHSNFYTTSTNTGAAQLIITDSAACNDTFNGTI